MATLTTATVLAGALVGAGILLVILGLRRSPEAPRRVGEPRRRVSRLPYRRIALGAAGGTVAALATGWPVVGVLVVLAVWGIPELFLSGRRVADEIAKVAAVEDWVRRLADVLVVGVGLGQAIATSVRSAPKPIRPELERLAGRVAAGGDLEDALRQLAADIDDPAADFALASLVLARRRRGPGLAAALTAVADALAEEVTARRKVEADRAKPRSTARAVTLITVAVLAIGLSVGDYLAPYRTGLGQLVLLGIATVFVVAIGWMHSMTVASPRERVLAPRTEAPS